ncbi:Cutinase transcription factor 1 beta like protein [Verticillium longisporum]|nr:Cutinase transcription factor 1 beta like protein [Verticillium longisporum]
MHIWRKNGSVGCHHVAAKAFIALGCLAILVGLTRIAVTSSSAAAASSSSFSSQTSFGDLRTSQFLASLEEPDLQAQLPAFVKPLPARIASEDVKYLHTKGALSLPPLPLQTALFQAYVEYVHPYMPLLDLREFLGAVNARDGLCGQVSLFLYQAIMFAATAFTQTQTQTQPREARSTTVTSTTSMASQPHAHVQAPAHAHAHAHSSSTPLATPMPRSANPIGGASAFSWMNPAGKTKPTATAE